ncbi:riboflavin synthase [Streptomyces zagrosensis]|uniref:Riboflavin synthase n=1 Tax=Streptomyces zagrosensis TaxID=1042984 RepID=A0A7W9Q8G2_9ACTN|nr:riboflavin synthase [Streptomyces zagrosensis]MBB5935530.1 riboflavin synthase [Streptomyces zagrosensis]
MFTGIVEELGEIAAIEEQGEALPATPGESSARSARLCIRGPQVTADARHGDSIAVNGVCLTVVDVADGAFTADVMAETLLRSSLGALKPGSRVNLERPMELGGRLGGHLVQGHVDGTGVITERVPGAHWEVVTVALPPELARYVVDKGSITVDGISLTVVEAGADHFTVSLIPTTLALTTLGIKQVGDPVNLEVDVLAKYVERLLAHGAVPGAGLPGTTSAAPEAASAASAGSAPSTASALDTAPTPGAAPAPEGGVR